MRYAQNLREPPRAPEVDGKNVFDELLKEFSAVLLFVDAMKRPAVTDDDGKLAPFREHRLADQQKEGAVKRRLAGNEIFGTFGGQRVVSARVFRQQVESNERVEHQPDPALLRADRGGDVVRGLRAVIEQIEDAEPNSGFDDGGRREAE